MTDNLLLCQLIDEPERGELEKPTQSCEKINFNTISAKLMYKRSKTLLWIIKLFTLISAYAASSQNCDWCWKYKLFFFFFLFFLFFLTRKRPKINSLHWNRDRREVFAAIWQRKQMKWLLINFVVRVAAQSFIQPNTHAENTRCDIHWYVFASPPEFLFWWGTKLCLALLFTLVSSQRRTHISARRRRRPSLILIYNRLELIDHEY